MSDGEASDRGVSVGLTLFLLVMALFTLQLSYTGVVGLVEIYQTNHRAVTTTATVTATDVATRTYADDGVTRTEYVPEVRYHYTVDGTRYESTEFYDEYDHTPSYGDRSDARAALPDRGPVTVHYVPGNPDRSFLVEPSVNWLGTVGVTLVVVPLCLLSTAALAFQVRRIWRSVAGE